MKKVILLFATILMCLTPVWAQNFGIAVQDQVSSVLYNPAAMGARNAQGFGYINRFSVDRGFEKDYDLVFSLGNLAYSYGQFYGVDKHRVAGGISMGLGMYAGAHYQWTEGTPGLGEGFGLSYMIRPTSFLSLAVKGEELNKDPAMELGFGFRPLFFNKKLESRLTLSGDARVEDGSWDTLSLGAFSELADGVRIFGDYNFQKEAFQIGLSLSFAYLETGSAMDASGDRNWNDGYFQLFSTFKKQRSFIDYSHNRALEYDLAQIIMDTPVRGYNPFVPREGIRTVVDFILDMEAVKRDSTLDAVIFRNQSFHTNFANMLEIESVLQEVKASGKKIYFYYDSADQLPYALAASVADGIYLSPAGSVYLSGFSVTNFYLKNFLEEWGVRVHNFRSHDYKTAYNSFSESGMSEAEREALQYVYDGLQNQMNRMIDEGRSGKLSGSAQSLINQGPFIYASKALDMGLVDALMYEDEFDKAMAQLRLGITKASRATGNIQYDWEDTGRPIIAMIYANGGINMGDGVAGMSIGAETMASAIRNARKNPMVRGIILRVNSGGGSSLASDLIAREVALCSQGDNPKPVIVSMGGSAASGGYYISAPATRIIASPVTITGSIGVITVMPEISGLLERFGIGTGSVKTAENADTGNILKEMTPSEEEMIREYIAENYEQFITLVGEHRQMPVEEVHKSAQGRIWTGEQALERGLVDGNGGIKESYRLMQQLISTDRDVRLVEIVPGRNMSIFERSLTPLMKGAKAEAELPLPEDLKHLMEFYKELSAYQKGEALYLMPYSEEELGISGE
ncbi:MAG: signal peptide peptidase SppA [Spirochaetales bacterium]|nr:signal peptide peptidase SppA [Spirochaetales bacterium]